MLALKLAYRNLIGAGLRTWLNVSVLSLSYVLIIWHQGLFVGMLRHACRAVIDDEVGGGQFWHQAYDPYDPFSLEDSHGPPPTPIGRLVEQGQAVPILIRQAAIYPQGRLQSALLKGIIPGQQVLNIPTAVLDSKEDVLPILIGKRMAKSCALNVGDELTIRWRDAHGTFDAAEGRIVSVMETMVPSVDNRQLWLPLERLQRMTDLPGEATLVVVGKDVPAQANHGAWDFKGHDVLLKDIYDMIRTKRVTAGMMYTILLVLAMLAIFDTQVLAIFKRRKEIGTLVALGMTRRQVVSLFTIEGGMHGILAAAAGAVYGLPLLVWTARTGIALPATVDEYGFAVPSRLYPYYSLLLVGGTLLIIMFTVTLVSYLPSSRISHMNPTDALKGKTA